MDHEQRCAALYDAGLAADPIPDGLLVLGGRECMLCKNSMRNNDYPTHTRDGHPITWLDIENDAAITRMYALPGIAYDYEREYPTAAGKQIGGTPVFLWLQDGKVSIGPLAAGEQPQGALDQLAAKAAERMAKPS